MILRERPQPFHKYVAPAERSVFGLGAVVVCAP